MKIRKMISGIYYSFINKEPQLVDSVLCGRPLKTFSDTIRSRPDQDDTWFFYLAKHHNIIFDIGANVGYTALLAMIQKPDREYILVDPNPLALQKAQGNLIYNNLGFNARYYSAFVSNKNNESVKFYNLGTGAAGSMYANHAESAAAINSFKNVNTVTLDFLYSYYKLRPDLIKIDVEGAEILVIEGAALLAKETKCTFFIEMHAVKERSMEQSTDMIINWAKGMGYKVWYPKTSEELITGETVKNRGKCHLLLLPIENEFPEYLKGIKQNAPLPSSIL